MAPHRVSRQSGTTPSIATIHDVIKNKNILHLWDRTFRRNSSSQAVSDTGTPIATYYWICVFTSTQ